VVPVHLNELSPAEFRGTFPGTGISTGEIFAAAYAAQQQAWLADHFRDANGNPNYALTMALVECFVFLAIILLAAIGPEKTRPRILRANAAHHAVIPETPNSFGGEGPHNHSLKFDLDCVVETGSWDPSLRSG